MCTIKGKSTHTNKSLSFDSYHPLQYKNTVSKTLFNRAGKICSTNEDRVEEKLHVKTALKENGYPIHFIKRIDKQAKVIKNNTMKDDITKVTVVLPFVKNSSQNIKRILHCLDIRLPPIKKKE